MSNKQQFENFKSALDAKTEIPKRKFLKKTLKNILGVLTDFPFVFTPFLKSEKFQSGIAKQRHIYKLDETTPTRNVTCSYYLCKRMFNQRIYNRKKVITQLKRMLHFKSGKLVNKAGCFYTCFLKLTLTFMIGKTSKKS